MSSLDDAMALFPVPPAGTNARERPLAATGNSLDEAMAAAGTTLGQTGPRAKTYQNQPAVGLIKGIAHPAGELAALQAQIPNVPQTPVPVPAWKQFLEDQATHPERGGLVEPLLRGGTEALTQAVTSIPGATLSGLGGFASRLGSPEQLNAPALANVGDVIQRAGAAITPGEPSTFIGGLPAAAGNAVGQGFRMAGQGYQALAEQAGYPRAGAVLGNVVASLPTLAPVAAGAHQVATGPALSRYKAPAVSSNLPQPGAISPQGVAQQPAVSSPRSSGGALSPFTNPEKVVAPFAAQIIGSDPATLARLKNADQFVPGSHPTTAQVIATPQAVVAERELRGHPEYGKQFYARDASNTSAQLAHIEQFGGSPAQVQAAVAARTAAVSKWTDPQSGILNHAPPIDATGVIDALSKIEDSSGAIRPQVRGAISDINNILKSRAQVDPETGAMMVRPGDLDALRQNSSEFLKAHDPHGAVGSQANAIMAPMHTAIIDTLDSALPGYRDYLKNYAQQSVPINTMEAVNNLRDWAGGRPLQAGGPGGSVPQLNYLSTAGKIGKVLEEGYGVSPEAQSALEAVQNDMQRATISNSVRSSGSDTAARLQAPGWIAGKLYGPNFQGPGKIVQGIAGGTGALTGGPVGAAAGVMGAQKIGAAAASRVNSVLARVLLDPKYAASIIEKYQVPGPRNLLQPGLSTALATGLLAQPPPQP